MSRRSSNTVHQPSRSNQEYVTVNGVKKRNTAFRGKRGRGVSRVSTASEATSDLTGTQPNTAGKYDDAPDADVLDDGTLSFRELAKSDRVKSMGKEIERGMLALTLDEGELEDYLVFMSTNYNFSARNQMLLHKQKPTGNVFKTAKQWGESGYKLAKGTRAAFGYRPYLRKVDKLDKNGNPVIGKDGKPEKEMKIVGYGTTPYFSENDLDESVKKPPKHPLHNHFDRYMNSSTIDDVGAMREDLTRVAESMGIPVTMRSKSEDRVLAEGAGGYARKTRDGYEIVLSSDAQPHAVTHTLSHEMAHILCGHLDKEDTRDYRTREGRSAQEVEAESMAYIISKDYGLESDTFAFSYLKSYAKDDPKKIESAMGNVSKGVKKYYNSLEKLVTGTNQEEQRVAANSAVLNKRAKKKQ